MCCLLGGVHRRRQQGHEPSLWARVPRRVHVGCQRPEDSDLKETDSSSEPHGSPPDDAHARFVKTMLSDPSLEGLRRARSTSRSGRMDTRAPRKKPKVIRTESLPRTIWTTLSEAPLGTKRLEETGVPPAPMSGSAPSQAAWDGTRPSRQGRKAREKIADVKTGAIAGFSTVSAERPYSGPYVRRQAGFCVAFQWDIGASGMAMR